MKDQNLFAKMFATQNDVALTIARVTLAGVMFAHGAQKALGWWGGYGFAASMEFLGQSLPSFVALLVIAAEFLGAIALLLGFFGRFSAASIGAVMVGAAVMVHWPHFFMDWSGQAGVQGIEFHILAVGLAAVVALRGSGAFSIDRLIATRLQERPAATVAADSRVYAR
jgi:putative oxidoreductase